MHTIATLLATGDVEKAISAGREFQNQNPQAGFLISALSDHATRQHQTQLYGTQPLHNLPRFSGTEGDTPGQCRADLGKGKGG